MAPSPLAPVIVAGMRGSGADLAVAALAGAGVDVTRLEEAAQATMPGEARWLLVYGEPWRVSASMMASDPADALAHPERLPPAWCTYHERLLALHAAHRDRALLVCGSALADPSDRFAALLRDRFALDVTVDGSAPATPELATDGDDPLPGLWLRTHPEATALLARLEAAADLPGGLDWPLLPSRLSRDPEPVLGVVVPCYDMGELLVEAVASVERTAPPGCSLCIIDDGSRDAATRRILDLLEACGYRVLRQENGGLAAARNAGARAVRGRYLLPLDADNRLLPGFLAAAIAVLDEAPEVGVVYGDVHEIGLRERDVRVGALVLAEELWSNRVDACAVVRRTAWEQVGGQDAGAAVWEDWELWLALAERGWRFHYLPQPTFEYRVRPGSMLATAEAGGRYDAACRYILGKHRALYERHLEEVLLAARAERRALTTAAEALRESRDRVHGELERLDAAHRAALADRTVLHEQAAHRERERDAERTTARRAADELRHEQHLRAELAAESARLAGELDGLRAHATALARELEATRGELARWQQRVAAMESTRAWRWRAVLLRLRGRTAR